MLCSRQGLESELYNFLTGGRLKLKSNEIFYALNIMHEQARYAELKNSSLIVFSSAFAFGTIANVEGIRRILAYNVFGILLTISNSDFNRAIFTFILLLFLSMVVSLLSFMPQIRQRNLEMLNKRNLFFFFDNSFFNNSIALYEYHKLKYAENENLEKDIFNQILNLSLIARRKYSYFKVATFIILIDPIVTVLVVFL
jgi:pycsar effector protein